MAFSGQVFFTERGNSKAAVPGAKLTIKAPDTELHEELLTDQQGRFDELFSLGPDCSEKPLIVQVTATGFLSRTVDTFLPKLEAGREALAQPLDVELKALPATIMVSGRVTDSDGSALPGAAVTITLPLTNVITRSVTTASGEYAVTLAVPLEGGDDKVIVDVGAPGQGTGICCRSARRADPRYNHLGEGGKHQPTAIRYCTAHRTAEPAASQMGNVAESLRSWPGQGRDAVWGLVYDRLLAAGC